MLKNKKNKGKGRGCVQRDHQKKSKEEYNKNPKLCLYCNSAIPYKKRNNKFCNHSCSASFNNVGTRRNFVLGTRPKIRCFNCGTLTVNSKYCCFKCFLSYNEKERKRIIKESGSIFSIRDKKYLIEERGNVCEICGTEEWLDKPILLILDHKDGDSDNNSLDNIRLICSNCDATLDTYKSKNRNYGRDSKRRLYRHTRFKNGSCN